MIRYTLSDFTSIPPGGTAIPPESSDYQQAVHLPSGAVDDESPWALVRGEGSTAVVDWVNATYLAVSGFTPAERLGLTFEGPHPEDADGKLVVRVSVEYPEGEGVYSWSLAKNLSEMVSDRDALARLVEMGDRSALSILNTLGADEEGEK